MENENTNQYEKHIESRKEYTNIIIDSDANKKIIIAGPGTGKSFLFQEICKKNTKNDNNGNLTLSFINELVEDLSKDLYKLSEVKTLHSLALGLIPGNTKMFIKLGDFIGDDYKVCTGKTIDFNDIFCNLIEDKEGLSFYSKRRRYYNFFSPNCSVFTLIKMFENGKKNIPAYSQILIDEYQDFNKLESRLLVYLTEQSPVLIVGDDDQSLYDFKHANPQDIRSKYNSGNYATFNLPYCSRCTEVIVDAYNNLIIKAQSEGFLQDRMPKDFKYFPSKEKDVISKKNNKIIVKTKTYQTLIAYNIDKELKNNFDPRIKVLPSVLIICPLRKQIETLEKALRKKGFKNIDASQKIKYDPIIDGLNLLLNDSQSNLGWRIIFQAVCEKQQKEDRFKHVLDKSISTGAKFLDLLDVSERKDIRKIIAILRKIKENKSLTDDDLNIVFDFLSYDINEIAKDKIKMELGQNSIEKNIYKSTPIKIATILGSKGLTRDYTFLVNFDDKYLLEKNDKGFSVTDGSICKFLVALTRAKIKTYVYTSEKRYPTYLEWIGEEFIEEQ